MKSFSPSEALSANGKNLTAAIQAVNELLSEKYDGRSSVTLKQDAIIARIQFINPELNREQIFANGMLNIESHYESAGWKVE